MSAHLEHRAPRAVGRRAGKAGAWLVLCAALAAGACNDSVTVPAPQVAGKLLVFAGNDQTGRVADPAVNPISVEVRDTRGLPMPGAEVTFASSGNGSFNTPLAVSDSDGVATALFTYGTVEGDYTITAITAGVTDTAKFTLHANPGAPLALEPLAGTAQIADAGTTLSAPLVVAVVDVFGNPIAGVTVSWSVTGDGILSAPTSVTDADGKAQVTLTLGSTAGAETVTAHADNVPDVVFTETAK